MSPLSCILERYLNILVPHEREHRPASTGLARRSGECWDKRVLLIDDQWARARVVGLVIGRRVDTQPSGTFDWDVCTRCQQV